MAKEVNYERHLFVGEDKRFELHVKDEAGASVDITGWVGRLVVKRKERDVDSVLDVAFVVDGTFSPSSNPQRAVVIVTDTQLSLPPRVYRHSWKRLDDGTETILAYGNFNLQLATQA